MSKTFHSLMAGVEGRRFRDEAGVDAYLDGEHVTDPMTRISVKLSLQAAGELGTDQTTDVRLATDRSVPYGTEEPPVSRELSRWMRQAGIDLTRSYTLGEVNTALGASSLGILEKMSIKAELYDRKRITASGSSTHRRTMEASAARPGGTILRNPNGSFRTLTVVP